MNQSADQPASPNSETEILETATFWLLKIESADCSDADRQAFQQWQQQDPQHAIAVQKIQQTMGQLKSLNQQHQSPVPHQIIEQAIQHSANKYLFHFSHIIVVFLAVFTLSFAWYILPIQYWLADQHSAYNDWSELVLPDQSDIKISGKTAYNLHFDQKQRVVELLDGNILVDVAKDAKRPFIIQTEFAQIKALGTRFIVQHHQQATILTMLHSTTEITATSSSTDIQQIHAGEQVVIDKNGIHSKRKISAQLAETAWQQQMLMIDLMPLDQVLDILQSYEKRSLVFDRDQLHHIEVSALLPLDGTGVELLQQSFPIQTEQDIFGRTVITQRQSSP